MPEDSYDEELLYTKEAVSGFVEVDISDDEDDVLGAGFMGDEWEDSLNLVWEGEE